MAAAESGTNGSDDPAIAQGGGVSQAAARDLKKSDEHSGRGTESRYAMIRSLSVEYAIKECCEALGVCRSGYYQWKKAEPTLRDREEAELVKQIGRVFAANKGRYGSPRVSQALRQDGIECGENRVARLMRENELAARRKQSFRPRTTGAWKWRCTQSDKGFGAQWSRPSLGQRYYLCCDGGRMAVPGCDPGSLQPKGGRMEALVKP